MKLSHGLVGHAGQYYVCAELSRRGWLASITLANAEDIDVLAHHVATKKNVAIQVKTSSGAEPKWLLSARSEAWSAPHIFFVFVLLGKEPAEFHVVPSEIVRRYVYTRHREWLAGTKKSGEPRKDSSMRKFVDLDGKYRNRWESLLESHSG
ncbi:hypothetical protein [Horticoccus sp. 23ND18S-11]|uniref:hypothetical protein n=1 Tax=Horticoccus sp. 23ND18S-11 TaxID=3391832 RepID=UPI0039C99C08